jgi:hypothetical protein
VQISEPHGANCVDTLRLSTRDWDQVQALMDLEREDGGFGTRDQRRDPRHAYLVGGSVLIEVMHPGGSRVRYLVRPRNLSRSGLGFLHGNFIYTGTRCVVMLLTRRGVSTPCTARVVRCRHIQGKVHGLGIKFDRPLDNLDDYLACPAGAAAATSPDPSVPQAPAPSAGRAAYRRSA